VTTGPFSLLMAVYAGDRPQFVSRAVSSSVHDQTLRPAELVLVQDGPVSPALAACISGLVAGSPIPVRHVQLAQNGGLARALQAGLHRCEHDVVARMDSDDVSLPERFARTVPLVLGGIDLLGTALLEIGLDEQVLGRRDPPTRPEVIASTARLHDPFNHPSVVYRRSAVLAAGGYRHLPMMEDYWLFARMIAAGARVANLPEALVLYRVAAGAYERRGGVALLRAELQLQSEFRRTGFTTRPQYLRNVVVRGGYRLVPAAVRRSAYTRVVAGRGARLDRVPTGTGPEPSPPFEFKKEEPRGAS